MNNGTPQMSSSAFGMGLGLFFWLITIAAYLFFAYTQYRIAQKCGAKDNAWWAFIPIMNILLFCEMARKPMWWAALYLVPVVNAVIAIILCIEVAKNAGYSALWGVALIIPFLNIVALIVMAFSEGSGQKQIPQTQPAPAPQQRTPQNVG